MRIPPFRIIINQYMRILNSSKMNKNNLHLKIDQELSPIMDHLYKLTIKIISIIKIYKKIQKMTFGQK